jgi:hypothetical protein
MNFRVAQQQLALQMKTVSSKVNYYFWRLSGDEPNSLCRLLGMEEEELKVVLRVCKVYIGDTDNFSKNNFEQVMALSECDYTTYRINNRVERFIRVGKEGEVVLPKDMYDEEGKLSYYPVDEEHVKIIRTKSQRGSLPELVNLGNKIASNPTPKGQGEKKQDDNVVHPKIGLLTYIEELVNEAANNGERNITKRVKRHLLRLMGACVDTAAKDLLHTALEKFALQNDPYNNMMDGKALMSPEKVMSATATVQQVTPVGIEASPPVVSEVAFGNEAIVLDSDDDLDDQLTVGTTVTATDDFISSLKEEMVLQTLLHKRIHDKKERVFQMEHRNGRRLLVVLPPDTLSVASFLEEATRTQWVDIMLNSEERLEGMLTHLARRHPDKYTRVGQKRDLSMQRVVLNTAQTIALARVGRLNDVRIRKVKSFLRQVGNVTLQMSQSEVQRIDNQVAWHRTKDATYGSYLHEWSLTKGK